MMSDIHTLSPFASLPEPLPERDENPEALFFPDPSPLYLSFGRLKKFLTRTTRSRNQVITQYTL